MHARYPVPSRYQVAVTLVVSILGGLSAGLALPLIFFGNAPLAMFLMLCEGFTSRKAKFSHGQTTFHNVDFTVAALHKKISLRKTAFHIAKQRM